MVINHLLTGMILQVGGKFKRRMKNETSTGLHNLDLRLFKVVGRKSQKYSLPDGGLKHGDESHGRK